MSVNIYSVTLNFEFPFKTFDSIEFIEDDEAYRTVDGELIVWKHSIDKVTIDGNTLTYVSFSDDVTRVTKLLDDEAKKFIKLKIDEWQYRLDNYER